MATRESVVPPEQELFLDILTKEEKEALLNKKMEEIRKKNERLQKRHAEIEADKREAEKRGSALKAAEDQARPATRPLNHSPSTSEDQARPATRPLNHPPSTSGSTGEARQHHGVGQAYSGEPRASQAYTGSSAAPLGPTGAGRPSQHTGPHAGPHGGPKGGLPQAAPGTGTGRPDRDMRGVSDKEDRKPSKFSTGRGKRLAQMSQQKLKAQEYEMTKANKSPPPEGPPPDPVYNFLLDRSREGRFQEAPQQQRGSKDPSRRHPRNFGGPTLENVRNKIKTEKEKQERFRGGAPQSKGELEMQMTGRERREYSAWKAERDRIDKERLGRQKNQEGQWKREWDSDKSSRSAEPPEPPASKHMEPARRPAGRIGSGRFVSVGGSGDREEKGDQSGLEAAGNRGPGPSRGGRGASLPGRGAPRGRPPPLRTRVHSSGSDDGSRHVQEQNDSLVVKIENEFADPTSPTSPTRPNTAGGWGPSSPDSMPQRFGRGRGGRGGARGGRGGGRGAGSDERSHQDGFTGHGASPPRASAGPPHHKPALKQEPPPRYSRGGGRHRQPERQPASYKQPDHQSASHRQPNLQPPSHRQPDHQSASHRQPDLQPPRHRQPEQHAPGKSATSPTKTVTFQAQPDVLMSGRTLSDWSTDHVAVCPRSKAQMSMSSQGWNSIVPPTTATVSSTSCSPALTPARAASSEQWPAAVDTKARQGMPGATATNWQQPVITTKVWQNKDVGNIPEFQPRLPIEPLLSASMPPAKPVVEQAYEEADEQCGENADYYEAETTYGTTDYDGGGQLAEGEGQLQEGEGLLQECEGQLQEGKGHFTQELFAEDDITHTVAGREYAIEQSHGQLDYEGQGQYEGACEDEEDEGWEDTEGDEAYYQHVEQIEGLEFQDDIHDSSAESLERFIQEHTLKLDVDSAGNVWLETEPAMPSNTSLTPVTPTPMKTPEGHVKVIDWAAEVDAVYADSKNSDASDHLSDSTTDKPDMALVKDLSDASLNISMSSSEAMDSPRKDQSPTPASDDCTDKSGPTSEQHSAETAVESEEMEEHSQPYTAVQQGCSSDGNNNGPGESPPDASSTLIADTGSDLPRAATLTSDTERDLPRGATLTADTGSDLPGGATLTADTGSDLPRGATLTADTGSDLPGGATPTADTESDLPESATLTADTGSDLPRGATLTADTGSDLPGGATLTADTVSDLPGGATLTVDTGSDLLGGATPTADTGSDLPESATLTADTGSDLPGGATLTADTGSDLPGGATLTADTGSDLPDGATLTADTGSDLPRGATLTADTGSDLPGGATLTADIGSDLPESATLPMAINCSGQAGEATSCIHSSTGPEQQKGELLEEQIDVIESQTLASNAVVVSVAQSKTASASDVDEGPHSPPALPEPNEQGQQTSCTTECSPNAPESAQSDMLQDDTVSDSADSARVARADSPDTVCATDRGYREEACSPCAEETMTCSPANEEPSGKASLAQADS